MFTVLQGEKASPLSTVNASNLLVTPCSALVATLCLLVVINIARSYAKSNLSTPFLKMPLIATRNIVMLSTSLCRIPRSICFLSIVVPSTLTNQLSDELHNSSLYSHVLHLFECFFSVDSDVGFLDDKENCNCFSFLLSP